MSNTTLRYLKERPVNSGSQGRQSNPQCHNSVRAVADPIARNPSTSDITTPSPVVSAEPNDSTSTQGRTLNGTAGTPRLDGRTRSHSPVPDHLVRDEGPTPVVNSSKEYDTDKTGNEVTAPWRPQHFRVQKQLITGSHRRTVKEIVRATFAHIYCTSRTSPSLLRSSTDALQEVGLLSFHRK
jgi:hypothetical protein